MNGVDGGPPVTGLRRTMGLRHLVGNGLVFIGPAAPVGIFGPLYVNSGGAVAAVYVVATVVMGLTALSYAQMSRAVPRAGSVYAYAGVSIGPDAGFLAGWMVLLDYMLIPSVAFLFTGLAMHSFVPGVPAWVFTAVAVVVTTVLNLGGVRTLARAAMAVVVAETVILALVLVGGLIVLANQGPSQPVLAPLTGIGGFSLTAVLGAVSVAALAYLGFDAIATFAEETSGSVKLVGRATIACLVVAGALFFVQTYVIELITPATPAALAQQPGAEGTAFYDVVRAQIAPWLATALGVAKAIGAAFAGMIGVAAGGRVVMAMAEEGRFPRRLGVVTGRGGVPVLATYAVTAVTLVLAVWAAIEPDGLDLLASTVSIGALCAFGFLHASVIGYFLVRRRSRQWTPHLVLPALGIATLVPVLLLADHTAQLVGLCWLTVGLVAAGVAQVRQRRAGHEPQRP